MFPMLGRSIYKVVRHRNGALFTCNNIQTFELCVYSKSSTWSIIYRSHLHFGGTENKKYGGKTNIMTPYISTFVYLDLETSGLPTEEYNRTKITEISLIAVKRNHLLNCKPGDSPRVKNKLVLCLSPGRLILPRTTEITGLDNDLLQNELSFEQAFPILETFMNNLEKPVCLLAHNGLIFDYPILRASLDKIEKSFFCDLFCADTLIAYKDILEEKEKPQLVIPIEAATTNEVSDLDTCSQADESLSDHEDLRSMQNENESTPKQKRTHKTVADLIKPKSSGKRPYMINRMQNAKRRLTFSEARGMKLENIYMHLLKKPAFGAHEAENDCMMNLLASVVIGEKFVQWVDGNHCEFSQICPMKLGVPLK